MDQQLSMKDIQQVPSIRVENLLRERPASRRYWEDEFLDMGAASAVHALGPPCATYRHFGRSIGAWLVDDADSTVTWVIYSDGHLKNPERGTSYELRFNIEPTDQVLVAALKSLKHRLLPAQPSIRHSLSRP